MFYGVILYLVHMFIKTFVRLKGNLSWIANKIGASNLLRIMGVRVTDLNVKQVASQTARHLNKLPVHIGIVIVEERISLRDLSNIIVWCLSLGVPHISIYDAKGVVKKTQRLLYEQTIACKEEYLRNDSTKYKVTFPTQKPKIKEPSQNGHKINREVHVHILSREDGKEDIILAARKVCEDIRKGRRKSSEVQQSLFKTYMKAVNPGVPDPDLIIRFGSLHSLVGFLPWHIRLSEILLLPTHHNVEFYEFMNVLEKFSHCQQRFGK